MCFIAGCTLTRFGCKCFLAFLDTHKIAFDISRAPPPITSLCQQKADGTSSLVTAETERDGASSRQHPVLTQWVCVIYNKLGLLVGLPAWALNAVPDWLRRLAHCCFPLSLFVLFWANSLLSLSLHFKWAGSILGTANSAAELLGQLVN